MTELTTLPTVPGTPFAGGFFVARYFLDGHEYLLIDAGQAGELEGKWGEYGEDVAATRRTDGLANTNAMAEAGSGLARQALALDLRGFADWYLPSQHEHALQFFSLGAADTYQAGQENAFARDWYWSSTQCSPLNAWIQYFDDGYQYLGLKDYTYRARAVRRFLID
ncbi:DUF1566 domain-containing protein [Pseudomonas kuykendallii]|uniref:DUF1566 domain-containing protein n=1 Tax=Pseudomonas kuykendallii TaxID=1007099 RepID=UPI0028D7D984|nr:DUF1566 domain-containing protein [Pseudomonas kuykendallii]